MISVYFFMSLLLYRLPLFHSATNNNSIPVCPESFSCAPNLALFKYPFFNVTDTQCGLIKVHCTSKAKEIQLGDRSYEIIAKLDSGSSVWVRDTTFNKSVENGSCEALAYNFTSPTPLLFSISIQPHITLYKCTNKSNAAAAEVDTYFQQHNYSSYNRCKDHNFYYKISINYATVPSDILRRCEAIELPLKLGLADGQKVDYNIFSLLSSEFYISFPLTPSCIGCKNTGRQCHTDNAQFQCLQARKVAAEKHDRILRLILALSAGVVTISIILVLCVIRKLKWIRGRLKWRRKTENQVNIENFLKNHEFLAPKRYSYSQIKKMTNSFKIKLGQGGFGSVYRGVLNNGSIVAVKVLNELKGNGEDFINEVASVSRTSHVNIVSLVGFCSERRERALIYEFMPNGSLERFIYDKASARHSQLRWEKLHQIAIGIARGLEYLHSGGNTRILHFDIKPHNILLDKDLCPKISDFGLAKLFPKERSKISMSCMRGTPGYIAPELFSRSFGQVSHKSDVYSYGMMILEMVGGRKNIEVEVDHTSEIYFPHWIYKNVELHEEQHGLHGIVSNEENEMARKMIIVGMWCIQTNPLSRPTITKVLEMLEGDLASMEIPPKPYLSSPPRSIRFSSTD